MSACRVVYLFAAGCPVVDRLAARSAGSVRLAGLDLLTATRGTSKSMFTR